jgi:hypothetical protein
MGQPLLQANFHQSDLLKAYRVAYLVKAYYIPLTLVMNNNQTIIHLEPNGGEKTWEPKRTKHVQMLHLENTRQIIMTVSSSATWDLPPPQIVFISTTFRTFPQTTKEKEITSKMVGTSHLMKIIGHPWKQLNNLSHTFSSLLIITYPNFKVKGVEDGVHHRLLQCSH